MTAETHEGFPIQNDPVWVDASAPNQDQSAPNVGERPFLLHRLGVIMERDPVDPSEAWGVLNPACVRARSGELFLFPRVVAQGNYSRIGIARVLFDEGGEPRAVERLGYALEPTASYEQSRNTAGCEDPRITFVPELDTYLMTYTAYGPLGPRIALAASRNLFEWKRLGPAKFGLGHGVDFDLYSNKDALVFPRLLRDPDDNLAIGLIHRPTYQLAHSADPLYHVFPDGIAEKRPSMWLSYCSVENLDDPLELVPHFTDHQLLAVPQEPWESLKIGGGTPPMLTKHGWLTLFHGVTSLAPDDEDPEASACYSAGAMVLDRDNPLRVLYRSRVPILEPLTPEERSGIVSNVVFPTAVDARDDACVDVYYGMADACIGVARLSVPDWLWSTADTSAAA